MLLPLLFVAATTGASSGPDLEDRAVAVDLPIERVMVFSDRARVTRSGRVKAAAGLSVVRLPDLPGAVMLDTLRVSADGAKIVRVETQPIQRERWSIDQVDGWLADLERLTDKIALVQGKLNTLTNELALMSSLDAAPPVPEKDRAGKPAPPLSPNEWRALQDRLSQRRAKARASERVLEGELRGLMAEYGKAQREVQKRDLGGYTDRKVEVLAIVDAARADPTISLEYALGGAVWRPAYDLVFDPDASKVELKASALVSQATGEDWPRAKLAFSTAIPGTGIDLPQMLTWTLGDDREYVPTASARTPPRPPQRFEPPRAKPRLAELERDADRALLQTRSQHLAALASQSPASLLASLRAASAAADRGGDAIQDETGLAEGGEGTGSGRVAGPAYNRKTVINFDDDLIEGDLNAPEGSFLEARTGKPAPPSPVVMAPPSAAYAPSPAYESEEMERPSSTQSVTRAFDRRSSTASARGMALRRGIQWQRAGFSDTTLPAVTAGGFDYVYDAPVASTVPSQAENLRVPLAAKTYDVTTFYEATPSLAKTAYLKATVKNGSKLPILQGAANVFVKGTFAGDALIATTGPGGVLELPLGADENIRVTRTVIPATKTEGFFVKDDVTDYAVKVEVGNYKKRAVTVRVIDQIPKTNNDDIKVELVSSSPKAEGKPDGDGLLYWHIDVPANGTKTVTFTYRITRPKGWRLSQ